MSKRFTMEVCFGGRIVDFQQGTLPCNKPMPDVVAQIPPCLPGFRQLDFQYSITGDILTWKTRAVEESPGMFQAVLASCLEAAAQMNLDLVGLRPDDV